MKTLLPLRPFKRWVRHRSPKGLERLRIWSIILSTVMPVVVPTSFVSLPGISYVLVATLFAGCYTWWSTVSEQDRRRHFHEEREFRWTIRGQRHRTKAARLEEEIRRRMKEERVRQRAFNRGGWTDVGEDQGQDEPSPEPEETPRASERPWHEVFGVSADASRKVVREAYSTLAKKLHPDHQGGDSSSTKLLQEVIGAWHEAKRERGWT